MRAKAKKQIISKDGWKSPTRSEVNIYANIVGSANNVGVMGVAH